MIDALVMMLNYDMACFRVSASIAAAVQHAAKQQGPTFQHTRPSVNTFAISASHYASASLSAKRLMTIGVCRLARGRHFDGHYCDCWSAAEARGCACGVSCWTILRLPKMADFVVEVC